MKTMCFFVTVALLVLGSRTKVRQDFVYPSEIIKNLKGQEVKVEDLESFLEAQMRLLEVPGVSLAIINDGKVVYHTVKGYAEIKNKKEVTNNTIFEGASLSKPVFAYLVMKLVEEGKLALDKPLHLYLPYEDIAYDERYKKITARMVLSHTTGFPNWRPDNGKGKLVIQFEPGTSFGYSGEGYQYLAKVVAHLLHTDDAGLEAFYQEVVAKPLQLKYTKYLQDEHNKKNKAVGYEGTIPLKGEDDPTVFGAAYSIHSEALDFSKWIIAILRQEGLSKESYLELFRSQVKIPEDSPEGQLGVTDWTLGFAKAQLPFGTVYAHGGNNEGYTSLFALNREKQWGFVIFTNADQSSLPLEVLAYINKE